MTGKGFETDAETLASHLVCALTQSRECQHAALESAERQATQCAQVLFNLSDPKFSPLYNKGNNHPCCWREILLCLSPHANK